MNELKRNEETFTYTYSAKQQEEVRAIRQRYLPKQEDKMETLRRLDRQASCKGSAVALAVGTVSSLVMGAGMSMTMVWTDTLLLPGIVVGLLGMAGAAAAYPIYNRITKREREKVAPEILRLTQELMK